MKGSIRQRSKGSWEICIDINRDPATGKRLRHFESVKGTKKVAQQRLAELLVSIEQGSYIKPKRITLGEWLGSWLNGYVATNCSPKTAQSYRSEVDGHIIPALGAVPLTQLQPQHLQNYYAHALSYGRADGRGGLSKRTVLYHHRILFEALGYAVRQGIAGRNVAQVVEPPHPDQKEMTTLTPSLAILLREYKTRKQVERLFLDKPLTEADFVFAHPHGTPLNPDTVTHAFGKLIRKAGLPHLRLHDLRHSHATLMFKEGIHPKIVQERLGHSNIATTLNIYSHVLPGLQEAAAERFDKLLARENVGKRLRGR